MALDADRKLARLLITVMLHKADDSAWTEEELAPTRAIATKDIVRSYAPLGAVITVSSDRPFVLDFADIDGNRMC